MHTVLGEPLAREIGGSFCGSFRPERCGDRSRLGDTGPLHRSVDWQKWMLSKPGVWTCDYGVRKGPNSGRRARARIRK
jgi:hypothetical protein